MEKKNYCILSKPKRNYYVTRRQILLAVKSSEHLERIEVIKWGAKTANMY